MKTVLSAFAPGTQSDLAAVMFCRRHAWPLWLLGLWFGAFARAQSPSGDAWVSDPPSTAMQSLLNGATAATLAQFQAQKLTADQLALSLVDLRDPARPRRASIRGDVAIYPASVVKLFYLAAAHRWMEDHRLADTPELRRALRDMIVDSSNDATHYVIDLLTDTTSGPELPAEELEVWFAKRNAVNRYFADLGYTGINVNKKPWGDGPYGRETQAMARFEQKRNMLTTDATARLLTAIATGKCVTAQRSIEMMTLLSRDPTTSDPNPENQAKFSGPALPAGARLWSKAGWTSTARHDAAYIELPAGEKFVLVVFTLNHASEREIIRSLVKAIVTGMTSGSAPRD